ncbi:hypothetical protein CHLRE_10g445323v5 [Chlamydomonas reinhardtii]|uniref:Uncharacterized protein n=1 Tax=Chlamydomonas reinhardtii TaxID=3055 RepID=A0A2K3DAT8_CHLRE|nr:uncharacterized protein CHLRE_10g445323v5 [Chlamydomonas reinhardtii]PNW77642.1 hypothetical protein CHLRE_10g445323v5 [Chlamydomonas reinhardtii]
MAARSCCCDAVQTGCTRNRPVGLVLLYMAAAAAETVLRVPGPVSATGAGCPGTFKCVMGSCAPAAGSSACRWNQRVPRSPCSSISAAWALWLAAAAAARSSRTAKLAMAAA